MKQIASVGNGGSRRKGSEKAFTANLASPASRDTHTEAYYGRHLILRRYPFIISHAIAKGSEKRGRYTLQIPTQAARYRR